MAETGQWRGTVDVAIKQLKKAENMSGRDAILGFEKAREEFFKESNILRILHHPHLVQVNIILVSFRGLIELDINVPNMTVFYIVRVLFF